MCRNDLEPASNTSVSCVEEDRVLTHQIGEIVTGSDTRPSSTLRPLGSTMCSLCSSTAFAAAR